MGTTLNGTTPSATYTGLLKFGDNTEITSSLKAISDGAGNDTMLELSTTALQIGGSTGAFWNDTNKRLGIGTNAPKSRVEVQSTFGASSLSQLDRFGLFVSYPNALLGIAIGAASSTGAAAIQGTNHLGNTNSRLSLNPFGGNVCIGQVLSGSGLAMLEVKGSGSTSATTSLLVQNSAGTELLRVTDEGVVNIFGTLKIANQGVLDRGYGNGTGIRYGYAGGSQNHVFYTNSGSQRMIINNDGYVGIGTDTPSRTLTVTGDGARIKDLNIGVSSATAISNTSNIIANFSSNGIGVKSGGVLNASAIFHIQGSGTTSATTALLVQNSAGTEAFKVNDAGDLFFNGLETSSMRIHTLGNANKGISIDNEIDMGAFSGITFKAWDGSAYSNFMRINGNTASRGLIIGGTTNNASAKLQIDSTTQGFLPPRMTTAQKNAIATPAAGLMVYDTDLNQMSYYNGTTWVNI
jgi:hypothetical protein